MVVANTVSHLMVRQYLAERARENEPGFVSERDLALEFNISRSNSRKLLAVMEHEGVVECLPQRGYRLIDYKNVENLTLYNIRTAVEKEAARLACRNASREDILRMWLILEEAEKAAAAKDIDKFKVLDIDFHQALINSAHDALVPRVYGLLFFQTVGQLPWGENSFRQTHADHWSILNAVRAGDAAAAQKAVDAHIGGDAYLDLVSDGVRCSDAAPPDSAPGGKSVEES